MRLLHEVEKRGEDQLEAGEEDQNERGRGPAQDQPGRDQAADEPEIGLQIDVNQKESLSSVAKSVSFLRFSCPYSDHIPFCPAF